MKTINISIALVFVLSSLISVYSQNSQTPDPRDPRPEYKKHIDDDRARHNARIKKVVDQSQAVTRGGRRGKPVSKEQRQEQEKAAQLEKNQALEEINKTLSTPPEYGIKYAEFLKGKNTGLARLFPDRGCDKGVVVSIKDLERCKETASIWGAGSLYSFRLNKLPSNLSLASIHYFIRLSDIHFVDGKFVVGTKSIQDIIADVGEVELTDVTLKSDSVNFLKSFKPGRTAAKVALQNQNLVNGVYESGFLYSTSAPINLNRTYVLRSIAYNPTDWLEFFWYTDVITAFKVVGQESDGSIVILWKELKESRAPYLYK